MRLEHPFPLMIQFTSIVCDGVLEKFPETENCLPRSGLRLAALHDGSVGLRIRNPRRRSFPSLKKKPSDYVKDCPVYVTCEPEETSLALRNSGDRRRSADVPVRLSA